MFNCNGLVVSQLINAEPELIHNLHKDFSFVENVRLNNGKILFWEKHYFRIIANLRRYRYKIPISFTMEKLEEELIKVTNVIDSKITNGLYRCQFIKAYSETKFIISITDLNPIEINTSNYKVDLYKDILIFLLGNLTTLVGLVCSYYFGSSVGSKDKTEEIKGLIKKEPNLKG